MQSTISSRNSEIRRLPRYGLSDGYVNSYDPDPPCLLPQQEITAKLDALQGLGHLSATSAALQRQRLFSELELAKRSDDQGWIDRAQHDLDVFEESLGATSSSSWRDQGKDGTDQGVNALLAKVNEKNKREAQETAKRAHRADQARRKLADQIGMLDPSARVKMKINKHDAG